MNKSTLRNNIYGIIIACLASFAMSGCVTGAVKPNKYIQSFQSTNVWSWIGIGFMETYGGTRGTKAIHSKSREEYTAKSNNLNVNVFYFNSTNVDPKRIAQLVQSSFNTVRSITKSTIPVDSISVYLVPKGHHFTKKTISLSIFGDYSTSYVIPGYAPGFKMNTVRIVSHELTHAWVGNKSTSREANEIAASTMEYCAVLSAFGKVSTSIHNSLNKNTFDNAISSNPVAAPTVIARYGNDVGIDSLLSAGKIVKNSHSARLLDLLCKKRARQAKR